jgi:hypothetical protein
MVFLSMSSPGQYRVLEEDRIMYLYMFGNVKVLFLNDFRLLVLDEGQKSQLSLGGLLWSPAGLSSHKTEITEPVSSLSFNSASHLSSQSLI